MLHEHLFRRSLGSSLHLGRAVSFGEDPPEPALAHGSAAGTFWLSASEAGDWVMRTRTLVSIGVALAVAASTVVSAVPATLVADTSSVSQVERSPLRSLDASAGGVLAVGMTEPYSIDPYNAFGDGAQVAQALFDSLTSVDPLDATRVLPAAAASWTVSSDATVWTFSLDPDGSYSDGTPVTAQDFVYGWNRIASPATLNPATGETDASLVSYHLGLVKGYAAVESGAATALAGVKAIDSTTLQVTLGRPYADFAHVVASPALAPVPKRYVEGGVLYNGDTLTFAEMPIGNGPFKMAEPWVRGARIRLARNERYDGPAPHIDGIDFMFFGDADAYAKLRAGNLDFAQVPEASMASAIAAFGLSPNGYKANPSSQVLKGTENSLYYVALNTRDRVLSKPKVRQAISYAIDRQAISTQVYKGTWVPADGVVPPGVAGYRRGAWPTTRYNVALAKKTLAAAGYPRGRGLPVLTLYFNKQGAGQAAAMARVKADLAKVGIRVTTRALDFAVALDLLGRGKFQMARLGWIADYRVADNVLFPLFETGSGDNYSKLSNAAVHAGLAKARATLDWSARIKAYRDIDSRVAALTPVVPLLFLAHHAVTSSRVHDLTYDSSGFIDFGSVWLTP